MSFNAKINNVILAEFKVFCDTTEITTTDDLFEQFKHFLNITDTKEVKAKKPRVSKEIPSNERCIALKADGGRCKMKKNVNGVEPDLCVTHNKNGTTKNGRLLENELEDEVLEESEIEQEDPNTIKTISPVEKKPKNTKKGKAEKDAPVEPINEEF